MDALWGLVYLAAFGVILYVFWKNRPNGTAIFIEEEPEVVPWWPWPLTAYSFWGSSPRVREVHPRPASVSISRPWGGHGRVANGIHWEAPSAHVAAGVKHASQEAPSVHVAADVKHAAQGAASKRHAAQGHASQGHASHKHH